MKIALIVAAGGAGKRFGQDTGKQFFLYQEKPLLIYTLEKFKQKVAQLIIAIAPQDKKTLQDYLTRYDLTCDAIVAGGTERYDSVRNALAVLQEDITHVFIHDGARPNVSAELLARICKEAESYDAVVPVMPVTDTIKVIKDNTVVLTPKRADLFAVQTPQAFRKKTILEAYAKIDPQDCTDDAMLVEKLGVPVRAVPGEASNIKITTKEDLKFISG